MSVRNSHRSVIGESFFVRTHSCHCVECFDCGDNGGSLFVGDVGVVLQEERVLLLAVESDVSRKSGERLVTVRVPVLDKHRNALAERFRHVHGVGDHFGDELPHLGIGYGDFVLDDLLEDERNQLAEYGFVREPLCHLEAHILTAQHIVKHRLGEVQVVVL